jgi:subtilisin family serine protease
VVQKGDPAGSGALFVSDLLASLQACVDADANIINVSLGGSVLVASFSCPFCLVVVCSSNSDFLAVDNIFESLVNNKMERRAMKQLIRQGILVVAASANSFDSSNFPPSSYPEVMSVGAVFPSK